jgi:hypothetical protein
MQSTIAEIIRNLPIFVGAIAALLITLVVVVSKMPDTNPLKRIVTALCYRLGATLAAGAVAIPLEPIPGSTCSMTYVFRDARRVRNGSTVGHVVASGGRAIRLGVRKLNPRSSHPAAMDLHFGATHPATQKPSAGTSPRASGRP